MHANPTSAGPGGYPSRPRFVLVNHRVPRIEANCALCCAKIDNGYVRDPQARLLYCDTRCFDEHKSMAMLAVIDEARRAS